MWNLHVMNPATLKIHNIGIKLQSSKDEKWPKGFFGKRFSEPCLIFNLSYQTNVIPSQSFQTDPSSRYKKEGHFSSEWYCSLCDIKICIFLFEKSWVLHLINIILIYLNFLHNLSHPCNINIQKKYDPCFTSELDWISL